ncbi:MAG: PAS domain-containing protein [Dehalococcoidia bacterium]|nr:PAS domain-containing protein [Dehalococcoidia bacterium]
MTMLRARWRASRAFWLTTGFGFVAAALVLVPLISLGVGQRADRGATELVETLDPAARAVDRVYIDTLAAVAEGTRYALQEGVPSLDAYEQIRSRYDLNVARLQARTRDTEYQDEVRGLIALSDSVVSTVDSGVEARFEDPDRVQFELVWAARPILAEFTTAAGDLQRQLEVDIQETREGYTNLQHFGLALSVFVSLLGGAALIALLGIERSRRALLRASERERGRFLGMVEATGFGVLQLGRDWHVQYVNPAGARMLGYAVEDLEHARADRLFHDAPGATAAGALAGIEAPGAGLAAALRGGRRYHGHEAFVKADGDTLMAQVSSAPVRGAEGVSGDVVVFEDLTPQLEREQQAQEFLALASHELRSPLTSITGFSRRLARRARNGAGLDAEAADELETLLLESERMRRMVELFLDMSRLDANVLTVEPEPIEVRHLVGREIAMLRERYPSAIFEEEYEDDEAIVETDEQRMRQIVSNLMDNAAKYGGVPPRVRVSVTRREGGIAITVHDNGDGIPPEDLDRVFDRFYRGRATSSGRKGLGLGLYISRRLAEHLGARLEASSKAGEGSEFRFWLPEHAPGVSRRGQRSGAPASSLSWSTRT